MTSVLFDVVLKTTKMLWSFNHRPFNQPPYSKSSSYATDRKYLNQYAAITKHVTPIYKIFRSLFGLQWIIHLFGLSSHIAHLLWPWIRYGQVINADNLIFTHQIYQFLFILFDGLALVIAHICALKINSYLRCYIREKQKKQLMEAEESDVQYSLTHLFLIQNESVATLAR